MRGEMKKKTFYYRFKSKRSGTLNYRAERKKKVFVSFGNCFLIFPLFFCFF